MTRGTLFLGSEGVFAPTVLRALLEAGCAVDGIWLAGESLGNVAAEAPSAGPLPVIPVENFATVSAIARVWAVPLQPVRSARELADLARRYPYADPPGAILAACFPLRLPKALLAWPAAGCFNLHPSLLPAFRGPTPLFWQMRAGLTEGGITLHVMTEALDAGDIVAQEKLPFPLGMTASAANQQLAAIGGRLAVEALGALPRGTLGRRPQAAQGASYYSWPQPRDFCLCTRWSAERAFRFIRGTAQWGWPYTLRCGEHRFTVTGVLGFYEDGRLERPWQWHGAELWVQFSPGILRAIAVAMR